MIRVLIVEDQHPDREIMKLSIKKSGKYIVEKAITDSSNAYLTCRECKIDLILMDAYTLEGLNGIGAAEKIKSDFPDIKIIMVTDIPEESFIREAKDAYCDSFWYKDLGEGSLISVMDRTMNGESVYPDGAPTVKIGLSESTELTPRELDVLRGLVNGLSQKDIGENLGITYDTVRSHIKNILSKTGYISPNRLVAEVSQKGFIIPDSFHGY